MKFADLITFMESGFSNKAKEKDIKKGQTWTRNSIDEIHSRATYTLEDRSIELPEEVYREWKRCGFFEESESGTFIIGI